ncbi:MAG: hypothetical protein GTN62_04615 [Gemmatimonadales bacterium]|nr:hypothetical protein [Gemmatimonadales bacterium]NIN10620.1 hypothetical protein [Gemmatimonadales bacterium]NIN49382.1 hypothetical protein [Gemmatimonadales bacterium]NIP06846.1 hypothetical protein [Gemmatimonadales bacterium]NIR01520.1 hypothetical protein [Gemmatimonadales bacterium]
MVATTVMAILGIALVRMLMSDSRFVSRQDAMVSARQTARSALNVMAVELRMVSDSGLMAASPDSVTVRIPVAFGMTCRTTAEGTIATLVPYDSLTYASAVVAGMAWHDDAGEYRFLAGVKANPSTEEAQCTADSIRVVPGGELVQINPPTAVPSGRVFYLYQLVTYRFAASAELAGRVALWRSVGKSNDEIAVPFDSAAGFGFLTGPKLSVQDTPPADLETVRGLELRLIGISESPPQGRTEPERFELVTQVAFTNKAN